MLRDMNYSLQSNLKAKEGNQLIDRAAQFEYINTQAKAFLAALVQIGGRCSFAAHG
jgi:Rhodopirellula transposase DDE domain